MKTKPLSILVVDDEAGFRSLLQWELKSEGMLVETAENGAQGLKMAEQRFFDVIISDITMPEMDGLALLTHVKESTPQTAVIITTGFSGVETAVYAMQKGAFNLILKPYDLKNLVLCIRRAADRRSHCRSCGKVTHE